MKNWIDRIWESLHLWVATIGNWSENSLFLESDLDPVEPEPTIDEMEVWFNKQPTAFIVDRIERRAEIFKDLSTDCKWCKSDSTTLAMESMHLRVAAARLLLLENRVVELESAALDRYEG